MEMIKPDEEAQRSSAVPARPGTTWISAAQNDLPTKVDLLFVFGVILTLVHLWSFPIVLHEVPALIVGLSVWDTLGVLAYVQSIALLEALVILGLLVGIGVLLPKKLLREGFLQRGTTFALVSAAWAAGINANPVAVRFWPASMFLLSGSLYLISLTASLMLVHRLDPMRRLIERIGSRVLPLGLLFLVLDLLAIGIILARLISA